MTDIAIVIVSWNIQNLLAACLQSIQNDLADSQLSYQIWVVDNASHDDTVAMIKRDFPEIQLIANDKNLGFAGGNNAALRAMGFVEPQAKASQGHQEVPQTILLLNPDTEVHEGALQTLFDFLQNTPQAAIAGAQLIYGDGSFQHGAFAFPGLWQLIIELLPVPARLIESPLNGRYARSLYQNGQAFQIGHPLGAVMAVRREAIQQVGLLDEQYHMYVEEVDWSKRIVSAGWEAYCVPAAVITHYGGQSTGQIKSSSFINLWRSRYRFYRSYYRPLTLWLARQIVKIGLKRQANHDREAAAQGQLSDIELSERLQSYQHIINIWQGKAV